MKFRKKPVIIEAKQFQSCNYELSDLEISDWRNSSRSLAEWCGGQFVTNWNESPKIRIPTLEGLIYVSEGSWIIKGVKGEFYPCKPDIFEATYEAVE
jgi:hypothetical protein